MVLLYTKYLDWLFKFTLKQIPYRYYIYMYSSLLIANFDLGTQFNQPLCSSEMCLSRDSLKLSIYEQYHHLEYKLHIIEISDLTISGNREIYIKSFFCIKQAIK